MDSKPLLYGLIGFFIGGLLVSIAATTFDKPNNMSQHSGSDMSAMTESLQTKSGDDFDKQFITHMIDHHKSAVDMAKLSETRAKHPEIKQLSQEIIAAQEKEITQMRQWQKDWGYSASDDNDHNMMSR